MQIPAPAVECIIYRCAKQDEMYLYLRAGMSPEQVPEALRKRTGALTQVMQLQLSPQRRLARVDVVKVLEKLARDGWYLQLPPEGHINPHLHFGDGM